ncbi:helix-turn-helix transcriptional regulator [Pluralibacter gergoviae]|nr:helix-turn-helix transcriptional regulator [Pluralibacter gergoviae]
MTSNDCQRYTELAGQLLEATLDSAKWRSVLETLSHLTGHQYAALLFYDKGNAQLMTDTLLCEEKVFTAYRDIFLAIDPAEKILTAAPVGKIYRDKEVLGERFIARSTYYNEFHLPNDMHYLTSVKLNTGIDGDIYLSLMTAKGAKYPQQTQFDFFNQVVPLLITASKLHGKFTELREHLKYKDTLLNSCIYPLWLVNHLGSVVYANQHAEHYSRTQAAHTLFSSGRLCLDTDNVKLKRAIASATTSATAPKASVCYSTNSRQRPILVIPSPDLPGIACVTIPQPQINGSPMMEIFHITPGENAVLCLLLDGMMPEECALHLNISITTVRTHLSALFRKTKTRSQAELLLIARAVYR